MRPAENLEVPEEIDEEVDASEFGGPLEWYWHFSQRGDFETDSEQLKVVAELQRLFEELEDYRQYGAQAAARHVHLGRGRARQVAHDGCLLQGVAPPPQAPRPFP